MNIDINLVCMIVCFVVVALMLSLVIMAAIFQVYGFTMTPELKKEEVAVKMCIIFNITDPTCDNLYGGIGPKH